MHKLLLAGIVLATFSGTLLPLCNAQAQGFFSHGLNTSGGVGGNWGNFDSYRKPVYPVKPAVKPAKRGKRVAKPN